jgi:hypothetical protein
MFNLPSFLHHALPTLQRRRALSSNYPSFSPSAQQLVSKLHHSHASMADQALKSPALPGNKRDRQRLLTSVVLTLQNEIVGMFNLLNVSSYEDFRGKVIQEVKNRIPLGMTWGLYGGLVAKEVLKFGSMSYLSDPKSKLWISNDIEYACFEKQR